MADLTVLPMSLAPLVVTGATGTVGREVVRHLVAAGLDVRAAVRDPGAPGAETAGTARFDYEAPETFAGALGGATAVFWLRPPPVSDVRGVMGPAMAYAAAHGAGGRPPHAVVLSVVGANPLVPHWHLERLARRLRMPTTVLRPSFFMQNLATAHAAEIRDRDEVFVPAGGGKTSFVDARDVGEAAARVMREGGRPAGLGHAGRTYTLTGSEALSYDEVAAILTRVLGRPVRYARPSPRAFRARKTAEGLAPDFVATMGRIYLVARLGLAGGLAPDLGRLLSRPPGTFEAFARDYAPVWVRGGAHEDTSSTRRRGVPPRGTG